jgi:hypothetical protein
LLWTARQRLWIRAQATVPPVLSIAVLLLIATLIHLDRFHRNLFGWFWIVVYALVPFALGLMLWRQVRTPGEKRGTAPSSPLPVPVRALVAVQGAAMLGVGIALFVAPTGADTLWPWPLNPLTAQAVGSFTAGFGIAALDAVIRNDLARFEGAALAYAALGVLELVAFARYTGDLTGSDAHCALYSGFVASVTVVGLWGLLTARRISAGR